MSLSQAGVFYACPKYDPAIGFIRFGT
jgi:hypothetical protein